MIETELAALRRAGVVGVQLGVLPGNHRAMGVCRHLGSEEIGRNGSVIFAIKLTG